MFSTRLNKIKNAKEKAVLKTILILWACINIKKNPNNKVPTDRHPVPHTPWPQLLLQDTSPLFYLPGVLWCKCGTNFTKPWMGLKIPWSCARMFLVNHNPDNTVRQNSSEAADKPHCASLGLSFAKLGLSWIQLNAAAASAKTKTS